VNKPYLLQDVQVPLQKLCKHSQWFDNTGSSDAGRTLVKPDRYMLSKQFKSQTDKIWQVNSCYLFVIFDIRDSNLSSDAVPELCLCIIQIF